MGRLDEDDDCEGVTLDEVVEEGLAEAVGDGEEFGAHKSNFVAQIITAFILYSSSR